VSLQKKVKEYAVLAAEKKARAQPNDLDPQPWVFRGSSSARAYFVIAVGICIIFFMALGDPMETVLHKRLAEHEKQKETLIGAEKELKSVRKQLVNLQKDLEEKDAKLKQSEESRLSMVAKESDNTGAPAPEPPIVTQDGDEDEPNTVAEAEAEVELVEAEALMINPLLGIPSFEGLPKVDWSWVQMESQDKLIIVVRKWVLDVTEYSTEHPGGNVFANGDDNTEMFYGAHGCDESILTNLATLVVARLEDKGPSPSVVEEKVEAAEEKIDKLTGKIAALTTEDAEADPLSNVTAQRRKLLGKKGKVVGNSLPSEGVGVTGEAKVGSVAGEAAEGDSVTGEVTGEVAAGEVTSEASSAEGDLSAGMECIDNIILPTPGHSLYHSHSWMIGVGTVLVLSAVVVALQIFWLPSTDSAASYIKVARASLHF